MNKLGKKTDTTLHGVEAYNEGMNKSLLDKIFFADKVGDATVFIDYGCADGALIQFLFKVFPDCYFLGYDESKAMMSMAARRFNCLGELDNLDGFYVGANHRIGFTSDWAKVEEALKTNSTFKGRKTCLIMSSVIHELYAYKRDQIAQLWSQIWALNVDYIAIRDMMVSDTAARPSDPISVACIRQKYEAEPLRAFESCWGSLNDNWALTHFLLKYRYINCWERELRENYLAISVERLLGLIPAEYSPIFIEHYTLPFLREQIWKDFSVQFQERSHLKLVLKRTSC